MCQVYVSVSRSWKMVLNSLETKNEVVGRNSLQFMVRPKLGAYTVATCALNRAPNEQQHSIENKDFFFSSVQCDDPQREI